MSSPPIPQNKYSDFADRSAKYIQKRDLAFRYAYTALWRYNYLGSTGSTPSFRYTNLDGSYNLNYDDLGEFGEITINGSPYSSCTSIDKREGYRYLDLFFKACMNNYNENYGL